MNINSSSISLTTINENLAYACSHCMIIIHCTGVIIIVVNTCTFDL